MHAFWQQRVEKEGRAHAHHLQAYYKTHGGIRLATPNNWDTKETVSEVLHGFYRCKSTPSLCTDDGVVCGHITLPKQRFRRAGSTPAASRQGSQKDALSAVGSTAATSVCSRSSCMQKKRAAVGVRPASPGASTNFTSISQRSRAQTNTSALKQEVEDLVQQQMDKVVQPLQQRLEQEQRYRMEMEAKMRALEERSNP